MSGKNVIQKILARAAGRESVETGEYLMVGSNCPTPCQGDSIGRGNDIIQEMGAKLFDPSLVRVCVGKSLSGANMRKNRLRFHEWAEAMGVPKENFVELGYQGVPHIVSGQHAWARPGEVYFSMTDGHSTVLGALGGFAVTLSSETGAYLVRGTTWVQVPGAARFTLTGQTQRGVCARDVYEYVLAQNGETGTTGQVILWDGDYVSRLGIDGRFTLCANALFSGAVTCIIEPDQITLDFVRARTDEPLSPLYGDPDAEYAQQHTYDVSKIEPQVVLGPKRANAVSITRYQGKPISLGTIASCANGRLDDMRAAASILKGRKVHPDVTLSITPGSMEVYLQAIKEGIMQTFVEAGVFLQSPSCAGCSVDATSDDVVISTGTRNYMGQAQVYLASPATVAASAVAGCITDPRKFL